MFIHLQISVDNKIPLWGVVLALVTYVGGLTWYFIQKHFNDKTNNDSHIKRLTHLEAKNKEMETTIANLKTNFIEELKILKGDLLEELKGHTIGITDLKEKVIKFTTVVEMRLLGDMRREKKDL